VYLAIVGGGAQLQWSIVEWVTHHRAHHWYTDTDKDPQDATKGFFFRHMGWLLAYKPQTWGSVNISDLMEDPVVRWQQKNYLIIFVLGGLGLPTFIAHFGWNDWQGGLVYAGFLRVFFSLQVVFFSGALMHADWAGEKTYSDKNSSVNMSFISILNNGEGNHNFHHTFPSDYRNGVQWYDIDLSKWMILLWCQLGLARNPVTVTEFEIERAHRRQERRNRHGGTVEYVDEDHEDLSALPVMQWTEYIEQANTGRCLVCINGVIHDISDFMGEHPGGRGLLHQVLADDGTSVFYNGSHDHSSHAKNVLAGMRIAVLEGSPPTNPRG
jgi:stearoyl-CoA desaturase (delta-9 desaturase)